MLFFSSERSKDIQISLINVETFFNVSFLFHAFVLGGFFFFLDVIGTFTFNSRHVLRFNLRDDNQNSLLSSNSFLLERYSRVITVVLEVMKEKCLPTSVQREKGKG